MSWFAVDYRCEGCGDFFESLETRGQVSERLEHGCGSDGVPQISAPLVVQSTRATVGYSTASTEKPPGAMDTRAIAEGQPVSEWRKERRMERHKTEVMSAKRELGIQKVFSTSARSMA